MRALLPLLVLLGCGDKAPSPDSGSQGDSDSASDSVGDDTGADSAPQDVDGDGFSDAEDCDDADPAVFPGAEEACDGVDADCDGVVDEDAVDALERFLDGDGDGYGDPATGRVDCEAPAQHVERSGDCEDADATVYPGAPEICDDGVVNDCEGDTRAAFEVCGLLGTLSLSEGDARLVGPGLDGFGEAVSLAGDVNGDGIEDVIVGATDLEYGSPQQGSVFLFHGPIEGELGPEDAAARVDGEAYEAYMGLQVVGPGDLNGDGVDDLVLASMHSQLFLQGSDLGGSLFVFHGPVLGTLTQSDADLELRVGAEHDHLGYALAYGDVDDDGLVDLITSTPLTAESDTAVAVFLGPHGSASAARAPDLIVYSRDTRLYPGISLDVGDVDGDGVEDMIVGGQDLDQAGDVRIFLGPLRAGSVSAGSADVVLEGQRGELLGWSVAALDDHDGDGYPDLAVGARGNSEAASNAGAVALIPGPLSQSGDAADLRSGIWLGEGARHLAAERLVAVGDWDGDGLSDVLANAPDADRAYLVLGPSEGVASLGDAALILEGDADDRLSPGLSAGNLDADPWPELLLGSYDAESNGQVYMFDGRGY
ncbi:MAG: FG-GAP repeat protein [Alphaproteobacteria bacterium]|nr:FG-GAP repeat protein [Alphaproteobacteria bacterium]MCB9792026.1 FG-GAP repeat protein [Alphaproteobacteria bacterium]